MKKMVFLVSLMLISSVIFATTVYDIQYTTNAGPDGTYPSPLEGDDVTVTGIVIGANFSNDNMFYMSDPGGGAWSGIYVYDFDAGPALGDEVEVTGTVTEYYGLTELGYCTVNILSSGNTVPDPIDVTTLDLVVPALAEQYEGCLVQVTNVTVTEAEDDHNQWYVDDGTAECQVDDGFFYLDEVVPPIVITVGMEWGRIIGCVDYSYDEYGINPRTPDDLIEEAIDSENIIVSSAQLNGNYPNPFNPETAISYSVDQNTFVNISIYNIKGEKVVTIVDQEVQSGNHEAIWNGKDTNNSIVSSGVYFYKMEANGISSTKKMILMK